MTEKKEYDLLQRQFDAWYRESAALLWKRAGQRPPAFDAIRFLEENRLRELHARWETQDIRRELIATMPANVSAYKQLAREMREAEKILTNAGVDKDEPTLFHAKKSTDFSGVRYDELTLCYCVRDLKSFGADILWIPAGEWIEEKQRLEEALVPELERICQRWINSPYRYEILEALAGRNFQERTEKDSGGSSAYAYEIIPWLFAKTTQRNVVYSVFTVTPTKPDTVDVGLKLGEHFLEADSFAVFIQEKSGNSYFLRRPSGIPKKVSLSDFI